MKRTLPLLLALFLVPLGAHAGFHVDYERGVVWSGYNDVGIPGDVGTRFSLVDDLDTESDGYFRLRVSYTFSGKHTLSGLYAPLSLRANGSVEDPLVFEEVTFPGGTELDATYTFNSYRLTYRYEFEPRGRLEYGLGFTAKIRDAVVRVEGGGLESEKSNVGFVPLVNFRARWAFSERVALLLHGDALAAPQGRAEDVLLALTYRPREMVELRLGYRVVEGGADNDEVYNFAWLNYALLALSVSF
ncbi:MAG: hypothetical protein GF405_01145 [Candidatus Eisenbacteria bacterium]|nr:hypothetical protein [Candidatus Eisenbacteria bacterium]